MRNIFLQNDAENEAWRLVPDLFFLKKAFSKIKAGGQYLIFNTFWWTLTWTYNKKKTIALQNVDSEICSILIFYKRTRD